MPKAHCALLLPLSDQPTPHINHDLSSTLQDQLFPGLRAANLPPCRCSLRPDLTQPTLSSLCSPSSASQSDLFPSRGTFKRGTQEHAFTCSGPPWPPSSNSWTQLSGTVRCGTSPRSGAIFVSCPFHRRSRGLRAHVSCSDEIFNRCRRRYYSVFALHRPPFVQDYVREHRIYNAERGMSSHSSSIRRSLTSFEENQSCLYRYCYCNWCSYHRYGPS